MCVTKSKSTLRLESFASTDEATKFILLTVAKSLLQTMPLFVPGPNIIPPSTVPLEYCPTLPVICSCGAVGKEQGPPANAYDGDGEGIALVILRYK